MELTPHMADDVFVKLGDGLFLNARVLHQASNIADGQHGRIGGCTTLIREQVARMAPALDGPGGNVVVDEGRIVRPDLLVTASGSKIKDIREEQSQGGVVAATEIPWRYERNRLIGAGERNKEEEEGSEQSENRFSNATPAVE
ncbi:hypothetical protein VTN00DRAFT_3910 [Thermoascus crustaceus]|uniref:uncharacterized protein n=1 Tax=Thermoascus crustaceus TaxID=5088 RepID=UPI0037433098